jgi:hypothetical protein
VFGVLAVGYLIALALVMDHGTFESWRGMIVAPVLVVATIPLLLAVRRKDGPRVALIFSAALILKLVATVVIYVVGESLYDGSADYRLYHQQGQLVADQLRIQWWPIDLGFFPVVGNGFVFVLTGFGQLLVGPSIVGVGMLFSWCGFVGYYLFFRAYRTVAPDAPPMRFAVLVCFLPSLLFWPSGIGKDAWMALTLGMATYGVARVLTHVRGGYLLTALGMGAGALVRPHVMLIFFAAFAPAFLLRRSRARQVLTPGKVLVLIALVIGGAILLGRVEEYLGVDTLDSQSVETVLDDVEAKSDFGGSTFEAQRPSVLRLPQSIVTVMFRPFPFEATNAQSLIASLEGLLLLALCLMNWRRLTRALRNMLAEPFVLGCVVFVLLFAAMFATIPNFGLLVRQRAQVLPFLFVLLAWPAPRWVHKKRRPRNPPLVAAEPVTNRTR